MPFVSTKNITGNTTITVNVLMPNTGTIVIGGNYIGMKTATDGSIVTLNIVGI